MDASPPPRRRRAPLWAGIAIAILALIAGGALLGMQFIDTGPAPTPTLAQVPESMQEPLADCMASTSPDQMATCLTAAYRTAMGSTRDAARRIPLIDRATKQAGAKVGASCHNVMHQIGRDYVTRHRLDLADLQDHLPRDSSLDCSAGFSHGMITALAPQIATTGPAVARESCYSTGNRIRRVNCIHGLGHAYLRTSPDVAYALKRCTALGPRDDLDCSQGIFHDYGFAAIGFDGAKESVVTERDPATFCATVPPRYAEICWYRLSYEVRTPPVMRNVGDLSAQCSEFTGAQRRGCLLSLAVHVEPRYDRIAQMTTCGKLPTPAEAFACARGLSVVARVIDQGLDTERRFLAACAALPQSVQVPCARHFGRLIAAGSSNDIPRQVCDTLRPDMRVACRDGAARTDEVLGTFT